MRISLAVLYFFLGLALTSAALADPPCAEPPGVPSPAPPVKLVPLHGLSPAAPAAVGSPLPVESSGFTRQQLQNMQAAGIVELQPNGAYVVKHYIEPRITLPPCPETNSSEAAQPASPPATPSVSSEAIPGPHPIQPNSPN